jgi:universal stress protein family protein
MGSPKWAIIEEANRWGADLVVLGAHGDGFLEGSVIGSIGHAAILHARCSVEIVRHRRAGSGRPRPQRARGGDQPLSGRRSTKSHQTHEEY